MSLRSSRRTARSADMGPLYLQLNRNKRANVLDLKQPAARKVLLHLCATADVFVHNIRPAAMRRLALSYDDVRKVNARLVYVGLMGYGESGPYAGKPAYDDLIQGICALPALVARAAECEPRYVPMTLVDRIVGINAAHVILAAVLRRDRTGEGQVRRAADVRDHGALRARRSPRRPLVQAADRRCRQSTAGDRESPALCDERRLRVCAPLYRQAVEGVLRGSGSSRSVRRETTFDQLCLATAPLQ